jgi:D-alanyl-D-alanine carboxypeptidase
VTTAAQKTAATIFLGRRLLEIAKQCNVPAMAGVLVRDQGDTIIANAQGVRKFGESGPQNTIMPWDRFCLGSIAKVYTAYLIGALIEAQIPKVDFSTQLGSVIALQPTPYSAEYGDESMDLYTVHSSGMLYTPTADNTNDWQTFTSQDATFAKRHARRVLYVQNAVKDAPKFSPGSGEIYGGGGIITAAMLEEITQTLYEDLTRTYLYDPLGMHHSGFGRLCSPGTLDGPWQHSYDKNSKSLQPDKSTMLYGYDLNPRAPVGTACSSAQDMGAFLAEQLRADPVVFKTTRNTMQTHQPASGSTYISGGWSSSSPGSNTAMLYKDGSNGSCRAQAQVDLGEQIAYAVMSNADEVVSLPGVADALQVAVSMDAHFDELFGVKAPPLPQFDLAHPCPAITCTGTATLIIFGRRHDGIIHFRRSSDGGATWGPSTPLNGWVMTSGIAAAAAPNGHVYVCGRGTDNQIWYGKSADGGTNWSGAWAVPMGLFETGPAIGTDATGTVVHVVAVGTDHRMYIARSVSAGASWLDNGKPIGNGVFTSNPAIAVSADGQIVHVFARGSDYRIWYNKSTNMGTDFRPHWTPIGQGVFTTGPAAGCSANGARVHVAGRGFWQDQVGYSLWTNISANSGDNFNHHWQRTNLGQFLCAPAFACDGGGTDLYVAAMFGDFNLYTAHSNKIDTTGQVWGNAVQVLPNPEYFL